MALIDELPAAAKDDPFGGVEPGARIRVFPVGRPCFEGEYVLRGGMRFVIRRDRGATPFGAVEGPIEVDGVSKIEIVASKTTIDAQRKERLFGEPYPGRAPKTAEEYRYRLERLAAAMAREPDRERQAQLGRQFDALADEISLSKPKRAWMRAAGRWALQSNALPRLQDLWFADVASPSLLVRPRPRDFSPDPRERRRPVRMPEYARDDPSTPHNVVKRLQRAGLRARLALAGDPPWDRAKLVIDLAPGRLHRFFADGTRSEAGKMSWRIVWAGNANPTADRRHRSVLRTAEYTTMMMVFSND